MTELNAALMAAVAPHNSGTRGASQAKIIAEAGAVLQKTLTSFDMTSNLRVAHFLAQTCHESDGYVTTIEYADGSEYNGRTDLGNNQPDDGPRFKGRGLIQLTGRSNYSQYGGILGLDLIGSPELAADPATSVTLACQFWKLHGLNALADLDDITTITRRINGGLNGLDSRKAFLASAKFALAMAPAASVARPVLELGATGDAVKTLQQALVKAGYTVGIDGDFGPGTQSVVKQWQQAQGLTADGVAGASCWAKLGV